MAKLVDPLVAAGSLNDSSHLVGQFGRSEVATIERPGESSLSAWASLELNCGQECPWKLRKVCRRVGVPAVQSH